MNKCRVMVSEEGLLYRWYHLDQAICDANNATAVYTPKASPPEDSIHYSDKLTGIPGVREVKISRYLVSVQLANSLFFWEDIEPKILEVISEKLGMEIEVVPSKVINHTNGKTYLVPENSSYDRDRAE